MILAEHILSKTITRSLGTKIKKLEVVNRVTHQGISSASVPPRQRSQLHPPKAHMAQKEHGEQEALPRRTVQVPNVSLGMMLVRRTRGWPGLPGTPARHPHQHLSNQPCRAPRRLGHRCGWSACGSGATAPSPRLLNVALFQGDSSLIARLPCSTGQAPPVIVSQKWKHGRALVATCGCDASTCIDVVWLRRNVCTPEEAIPNRRWRRSRLSLSTARALFLNMVRIEIRRMIEPMKFLSETETHQT